MTAKHFELSDNNSEMGNRKTGNGCFITTATGFVLALLAIAIAVGVGLIVHFAENRKLECVFPGDNGNKPASQTGTQQGQCPNISITPCPVCQPTTAVLPADKTTASPENHETQRNDVLLPRHLKPSLYNLTLKPLFYEDDSSMFTFEGSVNITMVAVEEGNNVTLHIQNLSISDHSIQFGCSDCLNLPTFKGRTSDEERQFEIFHLNGVVEKGREYYIAMNFSGPLLADLSGFYLSQYKRGNKTSYQAASSFEPTLARKAFPCFDEPALKAEFSVKLVRKADFKSVSNMPIIANETLEDGFVADMFMTTPKMSTYLLAFIVSDFDFKEAQTKRNISYRSWARPESVDQTEVALDTGVKILTFYEDYFNISFPLPKQDLFAVPDFAGGAMENWGLITFVETALLYKEGVSSEHDLEKVKIIVSHELAHQWFGNLVTMGWWDDLWLNEGFATFVEYMGVDHVSPDWNMFDLFVFEIYEVFETDSKVASHPIYVPVYNPDEINEIFDTISYAKGACVVRMARFFLGETTFQKGLQLYLKSHEYGNANYNDLWDALQMQADIDDKNVRVKDILDTWILQMNYPVVTVTRNKSGEITVKQDRFLTNKDAKDPGQYHSTFNYVWKIPFTYTTENSFNFEQTDRDIKWIHDDNSLVIRDNSASGWILGNVKQYGLYRVNYDLDNWEKLINQLKSNHTVIHPINRGQIINDAFGLAKAKMLPLETALKTLEYLDEEDEYVPWMAASDEVDYIDKMISGEDMNDIFKNFMLKKITPLFNKLSMNNTGAGHLESYLRSFAVKYACQYDKEDCVNQSKQLFTEYMSNPSNNPIEPSLKDTVYCTAVKHGDDREWNFAYNKYLTATVQAEKVRLLRTLSCTLNSFNLDKLLNVSLDESIVRNQDLDTIFRGVGANPVGKFVAWGFFQTQWGLLRKRYGQGPFTLPTIIYGITSSFNTEDLLQQLKDFQSTHPDMGSGTRAFAQAIERTESNIQWIQENKVILSDWLTVVQ